MTVIAACIDNDGRTAIGCDTESRDTHRVRVESKLVRWGSWTAGACGSALWRRFALQLGPSSVDNSMILPKPKYDARYFAEQWFEWGRARGHGTSNGSHLWLDGAWILARPGEFVMVGGDGSLVEPLERFVAIGSGAEVAVGAMAALTAYTVSLHAAEIVRHAIAAAIAHANGCGGQAVVEVLDGR